MEHQELNPEHCGKHGKVHSQINHYTKPAFIWVVRHALYPPTGCHSPSSFLLRNVRQGETCAILSAGITTKKSNQGYIRTLWTKQILRNEMLAKRIQVMKMKRSPPPSTLKFILSFWHRIPVSAKVVNGPIGEMCLLWRKYSEGKYCTISTLEQMFAISGNFRAGMADEFYEEKG